MDRLDRLILATLQEDGRVPFTQIARRAGVSETTIRTRYQKLVETGIVRTAAILDPGTLGYPTAALVAISVEPSTVDQIARRIARVPEVRYLITTLGAYDLMVEVSCLDVSHLTDVITEQIHPIPGIRATETFMIAESYKQIYDWFPSQERPGPDE
jgi:Lrp/AsnC family transcriptional regulator for asnA, asnC and gidA